MPDTIMIEKAELQQFLRWITDIEEIIAIIDKETDDYGCIDQLQEN